VPGPAGELIQTRIGDRHKGLAILRSHNHVHALVGFPVEDERVVRRCAGTLYRLAGLAVTQVAHDLYIGGRKALGCQAGNYQKRGNSKASHTHEMPERQERDREEVYPEVSPLVKDTLPSLGVTVISQ